jgi:hypothetical protein
MSRKTQLVFAGIPVVCSTNRGCWHWNGQVNISSPEQQTEEFSPKTATASSKSAAGDNQRKLN